MIYSKKYIASLHPCSCVEHLSFLVQTPKTLGISYVRGVIKGSCVM